MGSRTLASQWDETVRYYADSVFLEYISVEDEVCRYTYGQFDRLVKQAANYFLSLGIQKGELVAMHMHNTPEYVVCWLALAQIGAVSAPLNEYYRVGESGEILRWNGIRRIIVEPRSEGMYVRGRAELGLDTIIRSRGVSDCGDVLSLEQGMAGQPTELTEKRPISSDDMAVILFTSGTTRFPKGAIYTHCNVVYGGIFHVHQLGMGPGDRFLSAMPCYHMDFQEMAIMPVICAGGTLIMVEHYSARRFWHQICRHRANFTDTMSVMNRTMLLQPEQPWEKEHCLKQIYFSMGLSVEEKEAFEKRFRVRPLNTYGMTETVTAVTCVPLTGDQHWPSVGRPALSYEIRIRREDGSEAAPGEVGEICIGGVPGRSLCPGYYHNEKATRALYEDGKWLRSGDKGYLDEDGWLYFLGRDGDMIKRSGENVSALEVECILTSHPDIADAAVIGVPDPLRDYMIKAFVQLREGASLTSEEVLAHCDSHLAKFKVPSQVEFVSGFARTSTGKIKKNLLH